MVAERVNLRPTLSLSLSLSPSLSLSLCRANVLLACLAGSSSQDVPQLRPVDGNPQGAR